MDVLACLIPSSAVMLITTLPVLVKLTSKVAGPDCGTGSSVQVLETVKLGLATTTLDGSLSLTGPPLGSSPLTVAMLVKSSLTVNVQS